MMQPKRTKFRKAHKGRIHGLAKGGTELNFGAFGMKIVEPGRIEAGPVEGPAGHVGRQVEAVHRAEGPLPAHEGRGPGGVERDGGGAVAHVGPLERPRPATAEP